MACAFLIGAVLFGGLGSLQRSGKHLEHWRLVVHVAWVGACIITGLSASQKL
jgi:hypothetical protein